MRRATQNVANKFFPATLEQKTQIAEAKERNNALFDEIFESIITFLISSSISSAGFKVVSLYINSHPHAQKWIADEQDRAALPWLINFVMRFPRLFLGIETKPLLDYYHDFKKVILAWDERIAELTPAEILAQYGNDHALLTQAVYKDVGKIIGIDEIRGANDTYVIQRFYKIGEYANKQGNFNFELKVAYLMLASAPFIRHLIIEPALKPILHRIYNLRFIGEIPVNQLSEIKANSFLLKSNKEYLSLKKWSQAGVMFNHLLAVLALLVSLSAFYEKREWPRPEYMIFVFSTVIKIIINQAQKVYRDQKKIALENKLKRIETSFKDMLAFTKGELELYQAKSLRDCYITYRAHKYQILSDSLVNQVVKNTLVKNNIIMIDCSNVRHSFRVRELTKLEASRIASQVLQQLLMNVDSKLNRPDRPSLLMSASLPSVAIGALAAKTNSSSEVKEDETVEMAIKYFELLKGSNRQATNLNEILKKVKLQLVNFKKSSFLTIQEFRFNNLKQQYQIEKAEEDALFKGIKNTPITARHKKTHMQIVKKIDAIKKHLFEIEAACTNYKAMLEDKRTSVATLIPQARVSKQKSKPKSRALNVAPVTLFAPTASERNQYNLQKTAFAIKLQLFCDFKVDETALGQNIQIHALCFEIIEFMKLRAATHAQLRKDPSLHFSRRIETALSHTKDFIAEGLSQDAISVLHAEAIEFSQALINAVACDDFRPLETNGFCALILAHGEKLGMIPEVISNAESDSYLLVTGILINSFRIYDQPLPEGMLYSALLMVNLKAEIYDGYVQPPSYLEHMANAAQVGFKGSVLFR